jgi:hypothetical protein
VGVLWSFDAFLHYAMCCLWPFQMDFLWSFSFRYFSLIFFLSYQFYSFPFPHFIPCPKDPSRIIIGGLSMGGAMALHAGLRFPRRSAAQTRPPIVSLQSCLFVAGAIDNVFFFLLLLLFCRMGGGTAGWAGCLRFPASWPMTRSSLPTRCRRPRRPSSCATA